MIFLSSGKELSLPPHFYNEQNKDVIRENQFNKTVARYNAFEPSWKIEGSSATNVRNVSIFKPFIGK